MKKIIFTTLFLAAGCSLLAQTKKPAVKPKAVAAAPVSLKASLMSGKTVYNTYCISCHQADGGGVPRMNAPLTETSFVLGSKPALISILLKGMQGVEVDGEMYSNPMPSHSFLSNKQIADVLTYVRNNFGNKASAVSVAEVAAVRNMK